MFISAVNTCDQTVIYRVWVRRHFQVINMYRCFLLVLLASAASATTFRQCANTTVNGKPPISMEYVGCEEEPCLFVRGEDIVVRVTFHNEQRSETLKTSVRADTLGVIVDYPLPDSNACNALMNTFCPLIDDEVATYELKMRILQIYPLISLQIEHTLTNDFGPISCFWVRGSVVTSRP